MIGYSIRCPFHVPRARADKGRLNGFAILNMVSRLALAQDNDTGMSDHGMSFAVGLPSTEKGDGVLDPSCGRGTTLHAARRWNGRGLVVSLPIFRQD